jgi:hypothetical protein
MFLHGEKPGLRRVVHPEQEGNLFHGQEHIVGRGGTASIGLLKLVDGFQRRLLGHPQFFAHPGHGVDRVFQGDAQQLPQTVHGILKPGEQLVQRLLEVLHRRFVPVVYCHAAADVDEALAPFQQGEHLGGRDSNV